MVKKYISFSFFYFIGFFINYLVNKYLFENFDESEYGKFSYYYNLLILSTPFISFNIKDGVLRFYENKEIAYWQSIIILNLISIVLSIVLSFFFTFYFLPFFLINLYNIILAINRGRDELTQFNLQRILPSITLFLLIILFKPIKYELFIFYTGLSYVSSLALFYYYYKGRIKFVIKQNIEFSTIKTNLVKVLKFTLPTILTTFSLWAFNFFDQYIIEYYYGFKYLSDYAAATKILNVFKVILSVVLVVYPVFYYKNYNNPSKIIKYRKYIVGSSLFFTFLFVFLSKQLYEIFGATKYIDKFYLFSILIIAEFFRFISNLYLLVFSQISKNYIVTIIITILTLLSIFFNFYFVRISGDIAAAYISLILSFMMFIISLILKEKYEFK